MHWSRCIVLVAAGAVATVPVGKADNAEKSGADERTLQAAGLSVTDDALLAYFRKRTLDDADRQRLTTLIAQLGDDAFEVRERASAALVALGTAAEPLLRQALKDPDIEVVRRSEECLRRIKRGAGTAVPLAAARLLARRHPQGAAEVLLGYLPYADTDVVAQEVRRSLAAVALRQGEADPALVAALTDAQAVRRGAAGEALCRAGAIAHQSAVKKLLKDSEPAVRLQVAMALAAVKDRDAIPVLIDLLGILSREQAWPAEDLLFRLAGDQAPDAASGNTEAARRKCRDAWTRWWAEHGAKVDLARLDAVPRQLGYTLILLLDAGRVLELDAKGNTRWQVDGLQFPLDIQLLANEHVVAAEHGGNRVTERDPKGKIIWEKAIINPLVAQRLPNGNTFIATANRLLEVDRTGKELFSYPPPGGEKVMKAQKLRNGDIACVLSGTRFVRLDPTGKELASFSVNVHTSGGRIEVLPNGNVLVPEYGNNRVVEYDRAGNALWEAAISEPIAAVRLANGNTLVTSMNEHRAVEMDRSGKEVWEYKYEDSRVTRALRR
jgi:hypothetical protein